MPSIAGIHGQLFDTVGVEVEGVVGNLDTMRGEFIPRLATLMGSTINKVSLDRDASTESHSEQFRMGNRKVLISSHTPTYRNLSNRNSGQGLVQGYEFKTSPLEMKDVERVLYPLIWGLYEYGDVLSDRASIHVHVGYANNFRLHKSLLQMMLSMEPVLYRLGGMGGTFRGHLNNAAYCRPMLNSCVVPVAKLSRDKQYVQILNPVKAREALTLADFWYSMGVDIHAPTQHKYNSSRYAGMNFFSLFSHGTVEWRYFNKSFDVPLIVSIIKLMRAFVETASLVSRRELGMFDVIDSSKEISTADAEGILRMVIALCYDKGVEQIPTDNEVAHIIEVLRESSFIPLPELPTLTHIKDFSVSESLAKKGGLKFVTNYLPTNYVDIHNIDQLESMSIFT